MGLKKYEGWTGMPIKQYGQLELTRVSVGLFHDLMGT